MSGARLDVNRNFGRGRIQTVQHGLIPCVLAVALAQWVVELAHEELNNRQGQGQAYGHGHGHGQTRVRFFLPAW